MNLRKYFNILWRRKLVIFTTTLVSIVVVGLGTRSITPVYQASTILRIAISAGGSLNYSDFIYADRLMNTYVEIATSRPVIGELVKRLDLKTPPSPKVEIIPNTELIKIIVEDAYPARAALVANTLVDILIEQNSRLYTGGGKKLTEVLGEQLVQIRADVEETRQEYERLLIVTPAPEKIDAARQLLQLRQENYAKLLGQYEQAQFREEIQASMITVFERAVVPQTPSSPRVALNMALGMFVGLLGGLGLALLFENLDTTLHSIEDVEAATTLTVLAKIPKISKKDISVLDDGFIAAAEALRNLSTTIQQINGEQQRKVWLVVSAEPSQGKSSVVSYLAIALAEFGKSVIAIDCDTRIPRLHDLFQLSNQEGLMNVLEQKVEAEQTIQKTSYNGLSVLPNGSLVTHSSQLLGSPQMTKLIKNLSRKFDYILLDSPALLAVADGSVLAPQAHGFLLVIRQGHARREAVQEAIDLLTRMPDKFIGLIVNQVPPTSSYGYYTYQTRKRSFAVPLKRFVSQDHWALLVSNLRGMIRGK